MADNMNATATAVEEDAGMSQEYIDGLKEDLKAAERAYNEYAQAASKAKSEYTIANTFCEDMTDYLDRVTTTYNLVIDLEDYINSLVAHAEKVCTNVNETGAAVQLIIECYKCLSEDTEQLKQMIKDLLDAIDKLGDPILNPGDSLVKCLTDLHLQVVEALAAHKTAIQSLIVVWRSVMELEYMICNNDEDATSHSLGLTYDLDQLNKILCCGYCAGMSDGIALCPSEGDDNGDNAELVDCCGPVVEMSFDCSSTKPALCAEEGSEGFKSQLYCDLEMDKASACELADYKKCVWQYYEKKKQNAMAKRDAVKTALEAAQEAKALCN